MAIADNGTQIQVAYGGYSSVEPFVSERESLVYAEPGFTTQSPIEFAIDRADQFYFIIRKRSNIYGTSFSPISRTAFQVTATDVTLNAQIPTSLDAFSSTNPYYSSEWEDGLADNQKLILAVDCGVPISSPIDRVRAIDIQIKHTYDNTMILFRVLVDDSNKAFHYISVKSDEVGQRNEFSTAGSSITENIDGKGDSYVLISPFTSFKEVSKGGHDFAYPLNTIFYKQQETYNQEDFAYQITRYSSEILQNSVRVKNIPGYPQMGVIIMDRGLYEDMSGLGGSVSVDVEARGLISEMRDTFRITFNRV